MKQNVCLSVDKDLWKRYKEYCHNYGFSASRHYEIFIESEMEGFECHSK